MSKTLITVYAGDAEELRPVTFPPLERYASRHGYDIIEAPVIPELPPSWSRVPAMRDALDTSDAVLWLDADAIVVDDSIDVADELERGWMAFAFDSRCGPAAWLWALRASAKTRDFLDAVWARRHRDYHHAWEQGAVHELLDERNLEPVLLREPWCDQFGSLREGVRFAHASYNVGGWAARARYLATGVLALGPELPLRTYPPREFHASGFDCAEAVCAILMRGGLAAGPMTCADLMRWGSEGEGRELTVFANPNHAFVEFADGRQFGAWNRKIGWQEERLPHDGFVARHWPGC